MEDRRQGGSCPPAEAGGHDPGQGVRRPRRSAEQKAEIVQAFVVSGQSVAVFSAAHELCEVTLRNWLKAAGVTPPRAARGGRKAKSAPRRRRHFSPDEKRAAIEAYQATDLSQEHFARTWGVSVGSLRAWMSRYEEDGPQGLEPRARGRATPGDGRLLSSELKDAIVATKSRFPSFGMRKVRDFLFRFRGMKVSATSVGKTLREAEVEPLPAEPRRPRRKRKPPRRFERARPGAMWQTDITSYVLRRQGQRVYLAAFLDDHSRYVVSFDLRLQQRQELVCETLMEGIARFGKPEEVLSDQGRQYFAWRGKAAFQKLLAREGIRHVVSRTHHPQTLGKIERLWKTIGEEFWDRARPQDLADAKARLGHFIAHYNHFRPHQGIGGVTPADRLFGAEDTLRRTLEEQLGDELGQSLSERPRKSVFLFGRVGEDEVSLHGERGELVLRTRDGLERRMGLDELGVNAGGKESSDVGAGEDGGDDDGDGDEPGVEEEGPAGQEEDALCDPKAGGAEREGALGAGTGGGADPRPRDRHGDPGDLARQGDAPGGGGRAGAAGAEGLAAVPAGGLWHAGGAFDPAEEPEGPADDAAGRRGRSALPEEGERQAEARAENQGRSDRGLEAHAGPSAAADGEGRAREVEVQAEGERAQGRGGEKRVRSQGQGRLDRR